MKLIKIALSIKSVKSQVMIKGEAFYSFKVPTNRRCGCRVR